MSKAGPTDDEEAAADPGLDAKAIDAIGRALRAHYNDLVTAPLPDRFNELIARLGVEDRTAQGNGTGPEDGTAPDGGANASG
jgi:hypothetical protein